VGQEAQCTVRFGDRVSAGKALLESDELLFRGDFRLSIPFRAVQALEARDGQLRVSFPDGLATFDLGPRAEKWLQKIRSPRGLLDKLGVKPDSRVRILGVRDATFREELEQRGAEVSDGHGPSTDADLVFLAADSTDGLRALDSLRSCIKPNGAIWVISPKGKQARLKDVEIMAAAKEAGLVDVKVVSFSDIHTALKLVIPLASR
jgi:hypothetical protein